MGSYTDPQRFYLIDPDEIVNVDNDLNYNIQRADERVRPLVEYAVTDVASISSADIPKDTGFKWYKTFTGGIWSSRDAAGNLAQDPNSYIDTWSTLSLIFDSAYVSGDDEHRVSYSVSTDNWVTFRGRVSRTDGEELPANTTVDFLTPPVSILPNKNRYFFVHGGNAVTGDFQVFRVFIPASTNADLRMEFIKYGGNADTVGERFFTLNDITYPLNDTVGT